MGTAISDSLIPVYLIATQDREVMPAQDKRRSSSMDTSVFRIPPYHYLHVLDQTSNVTRLEVGPQIFVRKDNEVVIMAPEKMITVPPRHYCIIQNPVVRDENQQVIRDNLDQVVLEHAEEEVRLQQDPFPLYPGEDMKLKVTLLKVVPALSALRLRVSRDYVDNEHQQKVAGEEWMVKRNGAYLPGVYEEVVERSKAYILTEKAAVHIRAKQTFTNQAGKKIKSGEEYLITSEQMESFIPDVYEEVIGMISITTLTNRQYCVILNPVGPNGYPQLGAKKLIKGEKSFFLQPGEILEKGIQDIFVLSDNEGLLLRATEAFEDKFVQPNAKRQPGDKWMLNGPTEYIPPVEVEVVTRRKAIPLHENEGIYVRSTKTGQVRAVIGQTYMLDEDEELWEKNMPAIVRTLLSSER